MMINMLAVASTNVNISRRNSADLLVFCDASPDSPPPSDGWPAVQQEVTMSEPVYRQPGGLTLAVVVLVTAGLAAAMIASATSSAALRGSDGGDEAQVGITDDDLASASISIPAMLPGQTATSCIAIGPSEHPGGELLVHGRSAGALAGHLAIVIEYGEADTSCESPGTLTTVYEGPLGGLGQDAATAGRGHRPTEAIVPYLVAVSLDDGAPNSVQGATATVDLAWEVRPIPTG